MTSLYLHIAWLLRGCVSPLLWSLLLYIWGCQSSISLLAAFPSELMVLAGGACGNWHFGHVLLFLGSEERRQMIFPLTLLWSKHTWRWRLKADHADVALLVVLVMTSWLCLTIGQKVENIQIKFPGDIFQIFFCPRTGLIQNKPGKDKRNYKKCGDYETKYRRKVKRTLTWFECKHG